MSRLYPRGGDTRGLHRRQRCSTQQQGATREKRHRQDLDRTCSPPLLKTDTGPGGRHVRRRPARKHGLGAGPHPGGDPLLPLQQPDLKLGRHDDVADLDAHDRHPDGVERHGLPRQDQPLHGRRGLLHLAVRLDSRPQEPQVQQRQLRLGLYDRVRQAGQGVVGDVLPDRALLALTDFRHGDRRQLLSDHAAAGLQPLLRLLVAGLGAAGLHG